jgi:hypothetical protein
LRHGSASAPLDQAAAAVRLRCGWASVGWWSMRAGLWDAVRIMHENVSLLSEINELRRELKAMKDMQARTFPSRPFRTERAPNILHAPLCTHP